MIGLYESVNQYQYSSNVSLLMTLHFVHCAIINKAFCYLYFALTMIIILSGGAKERGLGHEVSKVLEWSESLQLGSCCV